MIETPKYLLYVFQDERVTKDRDLNKIINDKVKELVIGEEPTPIGDEQFGDREVYLVSKENTKNKELYDYLIGNGADVFTCRFDLGLETGDLEELTPFEWQEEEEKTIEIEDSSNDFIVDVLKFNLDSDIFQFVEKPEQNPDYFTFAQEQTGLSVEYGRLAKDIMAYNNENIVELVKKVEASLADDEDYKNLIAQEKGIEILKENSKQDIEELKKEFKDKVGFLSKQLTHAIVTDNKKEEAEYRELIKQEKVKSDNVISAKKARDKEIFNGNKDALTQSKYQLERKIIDVAETLVNFDIRKLYNYENRYKQTRDIVVSYFSVDKEKEIERIEKVVDEKTKIVEEKQEKNVESQTISSREQKQSDSILNISAGQPISDNEEQTSQKDVEQTVTSEIVVGESKSKEASNKKFSSLFPTSASNSDEEAKENTDEKLDLDSVDNYEEQDIQVEEAKSTEKSPDNETKQEFYKRIRKNDTIEFKDDFENQSQSNEPVIEKEIEEEPQSVKDEKQEEAKKEKQDIFVKKNVYVILLIASIIGTFGLSFHLLMGNDSNDNAKLESGTPKSSKVVKKSPQKSNTKATDTTDNLADSVYKNNLKVLTENNTGMYLDDNNEIAGTMKTKNTKGEVSVIYISEYTHDGKLLGKDKDGNIKEYSKEWVDNFVKMLADSKRSKETNK